MAEFACQMLAIGQTSLGAVEEAAMTITTIRHHRILLVLRLSRSQRPRHRRAGHLEPLTVVAVLGSGLELQPEARQAMELDIIWAVEAIIVIGNIFASKNNASMKGSEIAKGRESGPVRGGIN